MAPTPSQVEEDQEANGNEEMEEGGAAPTGMAVSFFVSFSFVFSGFFPFLSLLSFLFLSGLPGRRMALRRIAGRGQDSGQQLPYPFRPNVAR